MPRTMIGYISNLRRTGREIAYVQRRGYRTSVWTYGEVADASSRFARELEEREIGKGDRVMLWGENCAEWVAVFLGGILRGAIMVPMDRIASVEFARRVASQADVRLCVCSREFSGANIGAPLLILEDLCLVVQRHSSAPYPEQGLSEEDPVEIVFTSGTTAEPKGVVISHRNISANLEPLDAEIRKYLKYERVVHPIRLLNLLPLSHVFGQFLGIFVPPLMGAAVVFHDSLNPTEIIHTIKRERVSALVTVPRLLETLRDKIERDLEAAGELQTFKETYRKAAGKHFVTRWWIFRRIHNLFGWKFWAFISGGASLDLETENFWGRLGFAVIQGYGLTETTSLVSVNHPFRSGRGSIGKVLPGREIKLDASGEILVRGESIAKGYYQEKELRPGLAEEGWFRTGDIGAVDENGNLYFKGRKKNVIVTAEGMNIYPEDLEGALRRQPEVRDCVVVGLDDERHSEPCAVLLLKDTDVDPEPVVKRANESLAEFQHMRRWLVWPDEDLPRTSTQKPQTKIIQEFLRARSGGQPGRERPPGTVAELIGRITGRPLQRASADDNLSSDLNLSSIDRVELLSALEDRYQLDLNESQFSAATTIGELEQMLHNPVSRRTDYKYPRWAQLKPVASLRFLVYYLLSWPATVIMACPRVSGKENLRGLQGPVLFISNHITQVDVGFVLKALPLRYRHRLAVAMSGEMLRAMRHPPAGTGFIKRCLEKLSYGLVVALFNVFPLPQETGFRESFVFAGESADRGYSILVFPEGRRTRDGALSPFRTGIGMLANNLGLPIVPIRIDGLFELKQKARKFVRPGRVSVTVGRAVRFDPCTDPQRIAQELERHMAELGRLGSLALDVPLERDIEERSQK